VPCSECMNCCAISACTAMQLVNALPAMFAWIAMQCLHALPCSECMHGNEVSACIAMHCTGIGS